MSEKLAATWPTADVVNVICGVCLEQLCSFRPSQDYTYRVGYWTDLHGTKCLGHYVERMADA